MISFFFQLYISCFILTKACNCFKLHDYTLQLPTNRKHVSRSFMDDDSAPKYITRLWAIEVINTDQFPSNAMEDRVDKLARELSMENLGPIGQLPAHYVFAASNFTNDGIENTLLHHPEIEHYERQEIISLQKYDTEVPINHAGWQLDQGDKPRLLDCNIVHAWCHNINGKDVVVAIVDDGVEWRHSDLKDNYYAAGSMDFVDLDDDPTPALSPSNEVVFTHGTQCAGVASATGKYDNYCGVGAAYGSKFSAIRLLSKKDTSSIHMAMAINYEMNRNHIYSCSFGPLDNGEMEQRLQKIVRSAFANGAKNGRNSLGSIFVFASGNGGRHLDNCHYDEFVSQIYVIAIASVTEHGVTPVYGEKCSAIMTTTLSGGDALDDREITTATNTKDKKSCAYDFSGTSASAPLAAGIIALMLQVHPSLSWRDVHHIIAMTSSQSTLSGEVSLYQPNFSRAKFHKNRAGFTYSDYHGFGFLDAWRVTDAARVWKEVPEMTSLQLSCPSKTGLKPGGVGEMSCHVSKSEGKAVLTIENVVMELVVRHPYRGALQYTFTCPSGTKSKVDTRHKNLRAYDEWSVLVLRTVKCWGESPIGEFKLQVRDTRTTFDDDEDVDVYVQGLTVYGSRMTLEQLRHRWKAVEESYSDVRVNNTVHSLYYCVAPTIMSTLNIFIIVISCLFVFILIVVLLLLFRKHRKNRKEIRNLSVSNDKTIPTNSVVNKQSVSRSSIHNSHS